MLKASFKTIGQILTELGTNHPWVKNHKFNFFLNEGLYRFKSEKVEIPNLLLQKQRTNFNKTKYKATLVKGVQMKGYSTFQERVITNVDQDSCFL